MKILSAQQMSQLDKLTVETQKISSFGLMERAAKSLFRTIRNEFADSDPSHFTILCGKGNNGGDGLLLADIFWSYGIPVHVFLLESEAYSSGNLLAQERFSGSAGQGALTKFATTGKLLFEPGTVIVDCLFGYGLRGQLGEHWRPVIDQVNAAERPVLAVDMPSGLLSDGPTAAGAPVIHATRVYTFQSPKIALLMPENQRFFDDFTLVDIQLASAGLLEAEANAVYVTAQVLRSFYRKRKKFDHKGIFGHILLIGGSLGKMGSVQLASRAALRSGCGLLTLYIPRCGYSVLQTAVPEAMVRLDDGSDTLSGVPDCSGYRCMGIGIGMGTAGETERAFTELLKAGIPFPVVLDADALNILAGKPELWSCVPRGSVLTPHPKELSRIIGQWPDDWAKIEKVKAFAAAHALHVLIKGANSAMVLPDGRVFFNSTGNVGMATGGSGDVLTGIITALIGAGYAPGEALILGVYVHGRAADIAVQTSGVYSLLPSDIIQDLTKAFLELEHIASPFDINQKITL